MNRPKLVSIFVFDPLGDRLICQLTMPYQVEQCLRKEYTKKAYELKEWASRHAGIGVRIPKIKVVMR